jgi:hypothetical protein
MRPFDLSEYTPKELFRSDSNPKEWPAGAFDYQMSIYLSDKNLTVQLCEWLSENCTKNFIVSRIQSEIIAGGHTDNRLAWKQRKRRKRFGYDPTVKLQIRLHDDDVLMFRLAWVDQLHIRVDRTSS